MFIYGPDDATVVQIVLAFRRYGIISCTTPPKSAQNEQFLPTQWKWAGLEACH